MQVEKEKNVFEKILGCMMALFFAFPYDWEVLNIKLMQSMIVLFHICEIFIYKSFVFRYFDDDDEPPTPALAYIPAPGSPTNEAACSSKVI